MGDIKAPSIIKLKETLDAMTAEEKGTADIPDIDGLVAAAQRGSFDEGVWQSDFTVNMDDPTLYWNNQSIIAMNDDNHNWKGPEMPFLHGAPNQLDVSTMWDLNAALSVVAAGSIASRFGARRPVIPTRPGKWQQFIKHGGPTTGPGSEWYSRSATGIGNRAREAMAGIPYWRAEFAPAYEIPEHNGLFIQSVYKDDTSSPTVVASLYRETRKTAVPIVVVDRMDGMHARPRTVASDDKTTKYSLNSQPGTATSEDSVIAAAQRTSKMYMQFAANLINGLRMKHLMIGPFAPEDSSIDPGNIWREMNGKFQACPATAGMEEFKEDWLEQIEASMPDHRAAWQARIIEAGAMSADYAGSGESKKAIVRSTFTRGLDKQGMKILEVSDGSQEQRTRYFGLAGRGAGADYGPLRFNQAGAVKAPNQTLGASIIDSISDSMFTPGYMAHATYIPSIPTVAESDIEERDHPLYGYRGTGDDAPETERRFINTPGNPEVFGVFQSKPVAALLDDKTMIDLVNELYRKWFQYRNIAGEMALRACDEGDENALGEVGIGDADTSAEDLEAANAAAAAASAEADTILALAQTSPLEATFREQCYLLSDIFNLAGKRPTDSKPLPYIPPADGNATNASIEVNGTPFGFMNMLTGDPKMYPLMQAHHSQLSALQPTIRLFKVTDKTVNGDRSQHEQEFNFDSHEKNYKETTTATMLQNSRTRGHGAGIKNFEFTYDGSNPFAAKKSIKATLTIFANSFDELMKLRGSDAANQYRYLDLALKTGRRNIPSEQGDCTEPTHQQGSNTTDNTAQQDAELAKLQFRLKAVVGYAKPPRNESDPTGAQFWSVRERGDRIGILQRGDKVYNDVHDAVSHSFVTINLTPTVHDFAFDDMGRVTMTIKYLAYVEDFFDSPTFNIFSDLDIGKEVLHRKMRFTKLATFCEQEKMSEIKKSESQNIAQNKIDALQALFARMYTGGKIRTIALTYDQLADWRREGPYSQIAFPSQGRPIEVVANDNAAAEVGDAATVIVAEALADTDAERAQAAAAQRQTMLSNGRSQNIQFFYAGDLVDEILAGIEEYLGPNGMIAALDEEPSFPRKPPDDAAPITQCEIDFEKYKIEKFAEQFKRFRTVLGPIELVNQTNLSDSRFTNFGNVPVSVKYFTEWLTKQMLTKERAEYPLPHFLNNFFNMLIRNFLNDDTCFSTNIKQKIRVNQAVVTDYTSQEAWNRKAESEYESIDTLTYQTLRYNQARGSYAPLRVAGAHLTYGANGAVISRQIPSGIELPLPALNISGPDGDRHSTTGGLEGGLDRETNYLIYYAGRTKPTEQMTGDPTVDINNGILHYGMGLQNGIVRDISLKKTEAPYLPEVRFEQEGYDGLQQLRVTYDADIKTFPLPNAFPGQYLYIDPTTFAPGAALWEDRNAAGEVYNLTHFGIGGYFMIIRSTHRFGPGEATTTIQAKWVAEHEGRNQEVNAAGETVSEEDGGSTLDRGRCHEAQNLRALGSLGDYIDSPEEEEAAREALENPEVSEAP